MRHEIPTHLNVQDTILLGLSAQQLGTLMACAALGYRLWVQWPALPLAMRAALAGTCVLVGLMVALVRPGGQPLEHWGLAGLAYLAAPRRTTWGVAEPSLSEWRPTVASGWVELTPSLAWVAATGPEEEEEVMP